MKMMFEKTDKAIWSEKDARSVRTREALRRSFIALLETKPLDQITMREIAADACIGYTTFFRHYSAKDEILCEVVANELDRMGQAYLGIDPLDTAGLCLATCRFVDGRRNVWAALLTNGAIGAVKEALMRISAKTASEITPSTDWLPAEVGVILTVSTEIELLAWWLRQTHPLPVERIAEIMDRVIIGPTIRGDFR